MIQCRMRMTLRSICGWKASTLAQSAALAGGKHVQGNVQQRGRSVSAVVLRPLNANGTFSSKMCIISSRHQGKKCKGTGAARCGRRRAAEVCRPVVELGQRGLLPEGPRGLVKSARAQDVASWLILRLRCGHLWLTSWTRPAVELGDGEGAPGAAW